MVIRRQVGDITKAGKIFQALVKCLPGLDAGEFHDFPPLYPDGVAKTAFFVAIYQGHVQTEVPHRKTAVQEWILEDAVFQKKSLHEIGFRCIRPFLLFSEEVFW